MKMERLVISQLPEDLMRPNVFVKEAYLIALKESVSNSLPLERQMCQKQSGFTI